MNPYDFVAVDWSNPPRRRKPAMHDKFEGASGRIDGVMTAETPLFIPAARQGQLGSQAQRYITNGAGQSIIPGSSLKGLIRSLVETVAPGCWQLFRGFYRGVDYNDKLPKSFYPCRDPNRLCPACRMFGLISGGTLLQGHINFDDAVCADPPSHEAVYTPILDAPKPRHRAWYLDRSGQHLAGRKFYFHQPRIATLSKPKTSHGGVPLNQYIRPVGAGAAFTFSANFDNLNPQDELPVLLYALTLEPALRHKIGYAKPAGFGSVRVALTRVTLIDYQARYRASAAGPDIYEGEALADYLAGQTRPYVNDQHSITFRDLRRIWRWPPDPNLEIAYPHRNWFDEHPDAPIEET